MNNVPFPWGKVFANFLWIFGLAVVLADFGYVNFVAQKNKLKWIDIMKSNLFLQPIHVAGILVAFGLAGALSSPFLGGLFGVAGFLLSILYLKEHRFLRKLKRRLRERKPA
ncbi:hypothetical protein ACFLR7_03715 [Acidobacteriota bacterium]